MAEVEEEVALGMRQAQVHSSRRSPAEQRQAEIQPQRLPEMPQEQVAPRLPVSMGTMKLEQMTSEQGQQRRKEASILKVRDSMGRGRLVPEVGMPVLELTTCSCILCSKVVRQEGEGMRRV